MPKSQTQIHAAKRVARNEAGMKEVKLWCLSGEMSEKLKDYYDRLCDKFNVPENMRTKRK